MTKYKKHFIFEDSIKDRITCPITQQIMLEPMKACDGMTYEKDAIELWFKKSNISPSFGTSINTYLIPCLTTKNIINDFFVLYPQLLSEQYVRVLLDYTKNCNDIFKILQNETYDELKNYTNIPLDDLFIKQGLSLKKFFIDCGRDVQKHIIDNAANLDVLLPSINVFYNSMTVGNNVMFRFVHYVALHGSLEIFKYIITKKIKYNSSAHPLTNIICMSGKKEIIKFFFSHDDKYNWIDFNTVDLFGNKPIHNILKNNDIDDDIINQILDMDMCLESRDSDGNKPIHLAIKNKNISNNTIIYLIKKGIKMNTVNNNGQYPIHIACDNEDLRHDLINYLLKTKINLECCDKDGWRPIHYLCNGTDKILIKKIIDRGVNIECKTNDGRKPIHLLSKPSTVTMLKYIIDKNAVVDDIDDIFD